MSGNRGGHPQGPYPQGSGYYPYNNSYQQQQQQQQYGGAWQQAGGNAGWQPRPVSLQAQHYSHHYGPPVHYQPYGQHPQPPRPYVNYHQQPGPVYHGGGVGPRPHHHHMPPRPYLTSKPAGQKRKRKKDIVPPVERMVEDARVREPVSEAERKEIEAWKAERRKHWPTEENIRRKKEESDDRSIKLMDVLDTQKRLGLIKKAGTKELIDSLAKGKHTQLTGQRRDAKRVKKDEGSRVQPVVHRPTLLERLLEKDIRWVEMHACRKKKKKKFHGCSIVLENLTCSLKNTL